MEFQVEKHVLLRVLPAKGIKRVGLRGKLSRTLARIRHIFWMSPLFELREDVSFEEAPIRILAREDKKLRNQVVPYVKVQWCNHEERESTWELELEMRECFPDLFGIER